ncbi:MAG: lysophospholipid acyltransferase family protein [Oscillospiraceae bacterium]|jgi:1-acyl-sn-glycerol-3-phosphate acyltransferase
MKGRRRHLIVWKLFRWAASPWLRRKFNFEPIPADVEGPYLILANHNTDWDPFLVALSFRQHMYFVASEHIFRWGLLSRLIRWLFDPISRLKGTLATDTVMAVMRRLRRSFNVCLFAEGNRSWNGVTCDILPSTGKLARICGATLVTYKLEGGYFTSPRWGVSLRRGKMRGYVVGVYPPEVMSKMTVEEINALIKRDLFEDAYARQQENPVPFKGKRIVEALETTLFICPKCRKIGTLKSRDDRISCDCGLNLRFTEYGFFEGDYLPFDNITDWDRWQAQQLCQLVQSGGDEPLFTDNNIDIVEILDKHKYVRLGRGQLKLWRDRLEFAGQAFPLKDITGISIHGAQAINLGVGSRNFELNCRSRFCGRKYMMAYEVLKNQILRSKA